MNKIAVKNNIRIAYSTINKATKEILLHFNETAIHNFRTEIKKLKSLLLLAGMKTKKIKAYKLPGKLHAFYAATGMIRSLQLEQHRTDTIHDPYYAAFLKNEISTGTEHCVAIAQGKSPFRKAIKKLIHIVPARLDKSFVKRFSLYEMHKLKKLLLPVYTRDSSLHEARKILKNILYNCNYRIGSPVKMANKKKMSCAVERLGEFQDTCSSLQLLKKHERRLHMKEINEIGEQKEKDRAGLHRLLKTMVS